MSLCIYLCCPGSRWYSLSKRVNRAGSFLFNSLKCCVKLSLPPLPLKANPWRARKQIHSITFIKYFLSARFRLLVIKKCFRNFLPNIKPLRDMSFLHIMFCYQSPFTPYAKYTKNWVLFFEIVKPGKIVEPRGLATAFFLSKFFHCKKDNQYQTGIVLECFRCFRLTIFPHLCVLFLRFEHQIQFAETKKMFLQ